MSTLICVGIGRCRRSSSQTTSRPRQWQIPRGFTYVSIPAVTDMRGCCGRGKRGVDQCRRISATASAAPGVAGHTGQHTTASNLAHGHGAHLVLDLRPHVLAVAFIGDIFRQLALIRIQLPVVQYELFRRFPIGTPENHYCVSVGTRAGSVWHLKARVTGIGSSIPWLSMCRTAVQHARPSVSRKTS